MKKDTKVADFCENTSVHPRKDAHEQKQVPQRVTEKEEKKNWHESHVPRVDMMRTKTLSENKNVKNGLQNLASIYFLFFFFCFSFLKFVAFVEVEHQQVSPHTREHKICSYFLNEFDVLVVKNVALYRRLCFGVPNWDETNTATPHRRFVEYVYNRHTIDTDRSRSMHDLKKKTNQYHN